MYIHSERKLCYLAHPRTASSATANALLGVGFKRWPGRRHHDGLPEGFDRSGYRVFTTVRDPYDTVVSWMFFLQQEPPFTVADLHREAVEKRFSGYVRDGRLWWFLKDADVVLRYETLERDLDTQLSLAGFPGAAYNVGLDRKEDKGHPFRMIRIPPVNVGEARAGRPWRDFLGHEERAWVAETFAEDFKEAG